LPEDWEKSWDWQEFLALIGFTIFIPLFIGTLIGIIVSLANLWKPGIRKRQAIFLLIVAIISGLLWFIIFTIIFTGIKFPNVDIFSNKNFLSLIGVFNLVGIIAASLCWEKKD